MRDDSDYVLALTLTDDAWAPALRASEDYASVVEASAEAALLARELLLGVASLNASSSYTFQSTGWDDVVLDGLRPDHVTVVTNTTLEIALPPFPAYAIDEPETIAVAVPAAALASRAPLGHAPSLSSPPPPARPPSSATSSAISPRAASPPRRDAHDRLYDDNFVDEIGGDNDATRALLEQLRSEQSENNGWNGRVFPFIDADSVTRRSSTEVDVPSRRAAPSTRSPPPRRSAPSCRRPSSSRRCAPPGRPLRAHHPRRRRRRRHVGVAPRLVGIGPPPARRATSSWSS